jgi:hypothetical protein
VSSNCVDGTRSSALGARASTPRGRSSLSTRSVALSSDPRRVAPGTCSELTQEAIGPSPRQRASRGQLRQPFIAFGDRSNGSSWPTARRRRSVSMQRCSDAVSVLRSARLCSTRVTGARSAARSAFSRRPGTDVTAHRGVPGYAKSSAWRTALRLSDVGDGTATRKVAVEYPIGHRRRRHD